MIKQYPKVYEDVFSSEMYLNKCKIERVSNDLFISNDEYIKLLKENLMGFHLCTFDYIIKIKWLMNRFCYKGTPSEYKGYMVKTALGKFLKNYIGFAGNPFIRNVFYVKVISYLKDFFPDFNSINPFKEELRYPYKNINLDYLVLVASMDERIDLLNYAEDNNLNYVKFIDYVLNYINCLNDDIGYIKYEFVFASWNVPAHIKKYDNKNERTKRTKRRKKTKTDNIRKR